MIKLIIFDVGGVLVDFTNERHYYPYLSKASGMGVRKVKRIVEKSPMWGQLDKAEITQREFDLNISRSLHIHESEVKWYEIYEKEGRIDKKVMNLAKRLSERYKMAFLSNVDLSRYTYTLKLMKPFFGLFDYKFASCYVHRRKPDKEIYLYVLSRMKFKPEEAVFIDNQIENVIGARRAGLKAIQFKSISDLEKGLKMLRIIW